MGWPREFDFAGHRGATLRGYHFPSRGDVALTIVHGYAEHAGRYLGFAAWLAERGVDVVAFDLRGHGKSPGRRGHIPRFSDYLGDLKALIYVALRELSPKGLHLLGHSLGGLIVARYLEKNPDGVASAILSSPFFGLAMEVPRWKVGLAHIASKLLPWFSLPSGIDPAGLSHDGAVVEAYRSDPLVHHRATARWFTETLKAQRAAIEGASRIEVPLLLVLGEDDPIASVHAMEEFFGRCGSRHKEIRRFPGMYHEPLNEVGHEAVWEEVLRWLKAQIPR